MNLWLGAPLEWLALIEHELLLFAAVFFLVGALDELAMDFAWAWLKPTGRARTGILDRDEMRGKPPQGRAALLIPAWQEAGIIEFTIAHALAAWPHAELRLYVGCYLNDPETLAAVMRASGGDPRVRLVVQVGAGAWGRAQEGAERLDVGPTASVSFPLGNGFGRVAADYRLRVAGDAEPSSGPALTLSAGF